MPSKHTLVALVENKPGVMNRISSLFRRRGFNIESITVGRSEHPSHSRIILVVDGASTMIEQVRKQLDKVIEVVKVSDITGEDIVIRELALMKVKANSVTRGEIIQIADIFRANIIDVAADSLTIEITGDEDKIDSLYNLLRGFGIKEVVRTGRVAMVRGGSGPLVSEEKIARPSNQKAG